MQVTKKIKIDMVEKSIHPIVYAVQNDSATRVVEISLYANNIPWEIPSGVTAAIAFKKQDGHTGLYDEMPNGKKAITINGSVVTAVLAPQVLSTAGNVDASIVFHDSELNQLATFPFSLNVEPNPSAGGVVSNDYYNYQTIGALNGAIGNLEELDTSDKSSLVAAINEIFSTGGSGKPGKDGVSATHEWNGTVLTITSASGTSSADLKGEKGAQGDPGKDGADGAPGKEGTPGKDGYSIFNTSEVPTMNDWPFDPNNIVTNGRELQVGDMLLTPSSELFSIYGVSYGVIDARFVMLLKGDKGDTGATGANGQNGKDGADGKTPVKGVDYWTASEKTEIVEEALSEIAEDETLIDNIAKNVKAEVPLVKTAEQPTFVSSVEEMTDPTKVYVMPDGYLYGYGEGENYNLLKISEVSFKSRLDNTSSEITSSTTNNFVTGWFPVTYGKYYSASLYRPDLGKRSVSGMTIARVQLKLTDGTIKIYTNDSGGSQYPVTKPTEGGYIWGVDDENAVYMRVHASVYFNGTNQDVSTADKMKSFAPMIVEGGTAEEAYSNANNLEYIDGDAAGVAEWYNTGLAYNQPVDYEGRIVELESDVAKLEQQVEDIVDGTTEIVASAQFDPTGYYLPILYLTGDISPIKVSKDNEVTLDYLYGNRSGTCTLKGQGASSYAAAKELIEAGKAGKFNYTIKFDNAFEAVSGWGSQKKYCLKANFIDHTHSRNVVSCKLWGSIVKSRTTVPEELKNLPNGGAVDGFPVIIMLNNEFHGLYTFNIPKDGWMFGLVEDATKTQAVVSAQGHSTATQFKGELVGDESDFELEFVSNKDDAGWVTTSLNRLINACINSDGTDLDTTLAQYIDWDSAIDYYIQCVVEKGSDAVDKNFLLVTFDGTKWYFTNYDRDTTYGLAWDASGLTIADANVIDFEMCATTSRMFELIRRYKTAELKHRYAELRENILSESRICRAFETFAWDISTPILLEDVKKYPTIRGSSVNTTDQICRWVRQRLDACDAWIDAL